MSDKKIRTTLLIEIETTFNDNESTEDTVRFVVDEDLKDKGYNVISTELANDVATGSEQCNLPVVMPCLYKQSFIDRFNKYFEYKPKTYDYVGKNSKREYTLDDLHKEYEKAMGETPFK